VSRTLINLLLESQVITWHPLIHFEFVLRMMTSPGLMSPQVGEILVSITYVDSEVQEESVTWILATA
jgi:hypothetical protein